MFSNTVTYKFLLTCSFKTTFMTSVADGFTKEMAMTDGLRRLLKKGKCEMVTKDINKVICENEEIKMLNIRNRKNGGSGNC